MNITDQDTIKLLTKRPPETYEQFISRVIDSGNKKALNILLMEIKDTLRDTRSLTQSQIDRCWVSYKKVEKAFNSL